MATLPEQPLPGARRLCQSHRVTRVYIEYQGDSIELPVGETLIGRDIGCALRFNDPAVSRRHLRLVRRHDDVFVEDLGSTNGTLVNGSVVTESMRIADADTIAVGTRELIVRVVTMPGEEPTTLTLTTFSPERELERLRAATTRMAVTMPPPMTRTPAEREIDRRRHDRHTIELSLVYVSSELEIEATTLDLSESGVFVCSQVLEPVGTRCQLTILIDGGPPLRIDAIVRRVVEHDPIGVEPVGLGVEFISVGDAERGWLKSTVARMAAQS